ncbi:MAG: MBL fold metallo-hydrolase [Deltaproteobacteria bacterium]|nr:MBL fold metallo-hydrolase [Deltaproteobacteria bacterium]
MQVFGWQVTALMDGSFGLDGGGMFGIVPRSLWGRSHEPDEANRITMALRCLLISDGKRHILVDAGIGPRLTPKQQDIYRYVEAEGGGLIGALARAGLSPDAITDVVATHLHFDHVSGLLMQEGEDLVPRFPNATVHLQEDAWAWVAGPSDWDRASFFHRDFAVWEEKMRLHLLQGDQEIAPGVRVQVTHGHTPGHQIVLVGEGKGCLVFCSDLIPTATHVRLPYIMAYDHRPLLTLEEKEVLLAQAVEENWILVFEHDPLVEACRLVEQGDRVRPGPSFFLAELTVT